MVVLNDVFCKWPISCRSPHGNQLQRSNIAWFPRILQSEGLEEVKAFANIALSTLGAKSGEIGMISTSILLHVARRGDA